MFKNHPNKDKIRFIVLPIAREILSSTNDIAMHYSELIEMYGHGQDVTCGINFDFSNFNQFGKPELWQIYTIANFKKQKEVMSLIEEDENKRTNF